MNGNLLSTNRDMTKMQVFNFVVSMVFGNFHGQLSTICQPVVDNG